MKTDCASLFVILIYLDCFYYTSGFKDRYGIQWKNPIQIFDNNSWDLGETDDGFPPRSAEASTYLTESLKNSEYKCVKILFKRRSPNSNAVRAQVFFHHCFLGQYKKGYPICQIGKC